MSLIGSIAKPLHNKGLFLLTCIINYGNKLGNKLSSGFED